MRILIRRLLCLIALLAACLGPGQLHLTIGGEGGGNRGVAAEGAVKNVIATGPIPMGWPEQRVRLISQKISPQCKVSEQILKGQAALIKFQVPQIPKGGWGFVEGLYEI